MKATGGGFDHSVKQMLCGRECSGHTRAEKRSAFSVAGETAACQKHLQSVSPGAAIPGQISRKSRSQRMKPLYQQSACQPPAISRSQASKVTDLTPPPQSR